MKPNEAIDYHEALEISKLTDEQVSVARKYGEARLKSGRAEADLKILLASEALREIRAKKSNVGYDMAILIFCEDNETARKLYEEYLIERAKYKSLEKLIDAIDKKLSYSQSLMRYQREND